MTLTGLSNRGLLMIALLVAALWGCILWARLIERRAYEETEVLFRSGASVRPASSPVRPPKFRIASPVAAVAHAAV